MKFRAGGALLRRYRAHSDASIVLVLSASIAAVGMCFVFANFPGSRLPLNAVAAIIIMIGSQQDLSASLKLKL